MTSELQDTENPRVGGSSPSLATIGILKASPSRRGFSCALSLGFHPPGCLRLLFTTTRALGSRLSANWALLGVRRDICGMPAVHRGSASCRVRGELCLGSGAGQSTPDGVSTPMPFGAAHRYGSAASQ